MLAWFDVVTDVDHACTQVAKSHRQNEGYTLAHKHKDNLPRMQVYRGGHAQEWSSSRNGSPLLPRLNTVERHDTPHVH
jgi:hypothetical protein